MLEWIISSSILIAVIIVSRRFFKGRVSCRVQYGLWLLVVLRLLVPISPVQSSLSIANLLPESRAEQRVENQNAGGAFAVPHFDEGSHMDPVAGQPLQPAEPIYLQQSGSQDFLTNEESALLTPDKEPLDANGKNAELAAWSAAETAGRIWLAGTCILVLWLAVVNGVFRFRVRRDRQIQEIPEELLRDLSAVSGRKKRGRNPGADGREWTMLPVYMTDQVGTPCMYGLFFSAIYITSQVAEDPWLFAMVLRHEQMHYRQGDHIWAVLRTLCLCIHWYNPLVWLAVALSRQDGELACDEGVLRQLGEENRSSYGEALLVLSAGVKPTLPRAMNLATSMSGTRHQLRERLSALVAMPRMAAGTVILVGLLSLGIAVCTFTGRADAQEEDPAANRAAPQLSVRHGVSADGTGGQDMRAEADAELLSESGKSPQDAEESHWLPWVLATEYTGYLDECGRAYGEGWEAGYKNQDYDGDGLIDRIYQDVESEPGVMKMRVEFGNGEILVFDTYENSPLVVQSMDLDEDGSPELLFTKPNDFSTNPMSIPTDILLFTRREDGYYQVDTSLEKIPADHLYNTWPETYCVLAVSYSKVDDSHIRVNWKVPGAGGQLGEVQEYLRKVDEVEKEYFYVDDRLEDMGDYTAAYQAELIQERYAFLRIYFEGLGRSGDRLWVDLTLGSDGLSPTGSSIYASIYDIGPEESAAAPEETEPVYDSWDVQILEYRNEEGRPVAEILGEETVIKLTYMETAWSLGTEEVQYSREILYWACQALQELEQWTGTSVTEVCYSVTSFGDFYFSQTPGDMQHSRVFYDRCYGFLFGDDIIEQIGYATDMAVWFSPVKQYVTPPGYDRMTTEEIFTWYFERSAIARGCKVEETIQPWEGDYVIRTDQGTYYEFWIDTVGRGMSLYGPYDSYPQH